MTQALCFLSFLNLAQRNHHEVTLVHQGMGDLQVGCIDGDIIIKEDIDINRTVMIGDFPGRATCSMNGTFPQQAFDGLCSTEHLVW